MTPGAVAFGNPLRAAAHGTILCASAACQPDRAVGGPTNSMRISMSDYDRTANARYGAGVARSGVGAIDQGLRAYMIGVYNYMTLGLGITGLVAVGAFKLADVQFAGSVPVSASPFGQAIYFSGLKWLVVLAP